MGKMKVAVTLDEETLQQVDQLVASRAFPNRSRVIEEAVREKLQRLKRGRLARECAKLDVALEKAMGEEGMGEEMSQWPEY